MTRRYNAIGEYLLPSEREDEDDIYGVDDLELADEISSGMVSADQLTQKVALRQRKWDTLDKQAKFTRIAPPSALHGTLGGQQEVYPGRNAQVALWGGEDIETMPITVTFAPVQQIQDTPAPALDVVLPENPVRPYGIVQFGTRGFLVKAEVDINTGVQFTVSGSMVSVQVALEPTTDPVLALRPMKLSGMLSFYPVTHIPRVTRTRYVTLDAGGASQVLIPAFAREFVIYRYDTTASDVRFEVRDSQGNKIYNTSFAAGTAMTTPVELSGDAQYVVVKSTAGCIARVVFNLAF